MKAEHAQSSEISRIRMEMAFAISPCDKILVIDKSNTGRIFFNLKNAIDKNLCFAVRPHDDILAIDFDNPESQEPKFKEIVECIKGNGIRPVIISSGSDGHRHLFCRISDIKLRRQIVNFISAKGALSWVRRNTFIRPPLSPHRSGLEVSLVEPLSCEEAICFLSRSSSKVDIDESVNKKIKLGWKGGFGYQSGSELVQSIVNSLHMSGLGFDDIFNILSDPKNLGGASLQNRIRKRGEETARDWLMLSYKKAEKFVCINDPERSQEWIDSFIYKINQSHSLGRRRLSIIRLIKSHFDIASKAKSYRYTASVRQLALEAAISSTVTVTKGNRELEKLGLIRRTRKGLGATGSCWELCYPAAMRSASSCSASDTLNSTLRKEDNLRGRGSSVIRSSHFDHDAFRYSFDSRRGLGTSAAIILGCLMESDGLRIAQICRLTGFSRSTVGRVLGRLLEARLVEKRKLRWVVCSGNLDDRLSEHAERSGLLGARARQAGRYEKEREDYIRMYSSRYIRMKA